MSALGTVTATPTIFARWARTVEKVEPEATRILRTGNKRGFTTIELMVALVIVVIMSTVVVVSMGPALEEARLRSGCRIIASALNYARSYAVTRQTYARVTLDKAKNGVLVETVVSDETGELRLQHLTTPSGRFRKLPEGVKILEVRKPGTDEEEPYVGFSQLGQADDTVIIITNGQDKERAVVVDPVTGRSSIVTEEK